MDLWQFLMELVMLLGGAFVLGAVAQRLRQSPIVGYLLAGAVIGPLLFNAEVVNQTAELGVALLLFSIGLEFSFGRLRRMGRMAFGGGSLQVVATLTIVALVLVKPLGLAQALTIGAIVSLSSTAVVMRVLVDRAEVDSVRGRSCLSILLLQDIAIVPLVLMVTLFTPTAADISVALHILKIGGAALGLVLVLYLLLYHLVPRLLSVGGVFANRELSVLLALAVALGAAWAAHTMGISPALGAFVAGMLLGESPFATQIRADIGAVRTIMVTLFFASVGMLAKPVWFFSHIHWVVLAAAVIVVFKSILIFMVGRLFGLDRRQSMATGISLAQVGEFSFVLATVAYGGGIVGGYSFDLIVSVIILLIFLAPYMVAWAHPLADGLGFILGQAGSGDPDAAERPKEAGQQVMVVGFGPAGREVAEALLARGLTPVVVDINPQSVKTGRTMGIEVHLGDASHEEVLVHTGLADVCMAVVTVPDSRAAAAVVALMRRLRPTLAIAVRCRYNRHLPDLKKAGADMIVDEEIGSGKMLAQHIMSFIQESSGEVIACRLAGQEPEVIS
jgi:CPA2 family monovalent cation:H+ antiporter-2